MKQLRWVSSQNFPGREKCILASLEFTFFTHGEVSIEICITNAHFISKIPQKRWSVEEEQICFPLWTFSIHRDIIVIYGHEASWKHARSEVTNIYHRNVKLFFIRTQNSMFSRPSETSNIGIDQFTNRPIEYCEFVIMSILLFLETLTFKLFLKPWTAFAGVMMFVFFLQNKEKGTSTINHQESHRIHSMGVGGY